MECADILIAAGRRRSPSPSPSGWHPARQWRKAFNIIRACRWLARGVRILSAGALTRSASYVAINIHRESHSDADAAELFAAAAVDESFRGLVKEKRKDCFLRLGGGAGIMARLFSGKERGILGDADDVRRRKEAFGQNSYPKPKLKSFFVCFWDALKDVFLLSLLVCSAISVGFGIKKHGLKDGWYDGVSIFVAVFILTGVSAAGSHSQAKRYDKLASESADIAVTVVRAARRQEVSVFHVVVGDVVILKIGDAVPADGVFLEGHGLLVDDSTLTGEFHPHRVEIDAEKNPFLTAGVKVVDGYARMLVTAVGTDTSWGELLSIHASLNTDPAPLQKRLESLISTIGKVCVAVAVVHFTDSGKLPLLDKGVPLAVTLVVSFSMKRMVKDNALVNHLSAFQKLASVTVICADKTGTLTTKQMKVTEFWVGTDQPREATAIAGGVLRLLRQGAGLNTTGSVYRQGNVSPLEISGSPTEKALLSWAVADLCTDTNELKSSYEVIHVEAFNSRQKHSRVIARDNANGVVTAHWKGAAEVVLAKCSMYMDTEGAAGKVGVEQRKELEKVINDMSAGGLRCIAFAYKQVDGTGQSKMDDDEGLTLLGMVGIKDPCRPEVEATIDTCRKAGIAVKMVTGGNIVTARAMAIECGIISGNDPDDVVVEGCVFRNMSVVRQLEMADNMRVMVASRPLDKLLLVSRLQQKGHVVAVTGDRTNDAAALRKADVVLSMGAQGTDVDKDTIILSNKFDTVVTAASSGRCIYSNIQKFIQFNLTVNFVLASTRGIISLTTLQILWVNLMMPTMGALALVTEKPTDALMDSPPIPRMAPLISNAMWRNMAAQAAFQIAVLLALQYLGRDFLGTDDKSNGTMIFNVFVLCQAFNEFNSRDIVKRNIFAGVLNNKMFLVVVAATLVLQVVMVEVLTRVAGTERLGLRLWGICVGIAAVSWPLGWAVKCIPVPVEHAVNATHVAGDDGRRAGALELAEVHPSDAQDEPWHTSSPGSSIV